MNSNMKITQPIELAAFAITKNTDSARTIEHLDAVDRMIDNFSRLFGCSIVGDLREYVNIRRQELLLKSRTHKKTYGTSWNWIRHICSGTYNVADMACNLSR